MDKVEDRRKEIKQSRRDGAHFMEDECIHFK